MNWEEYNSLQLLLLLLIIMMMMIIMLFTNILIVVVIVSMDVIVERCTQLYWANVKEKWERFHLLADFVWQLIYIHSSLFRCVWIFCIRFVRSFAGSLVHSCIHSFLLAFIPFNPFEGGKFIMAFSWVWNLFQFVRELVVAIFDNFEWKNVMFQFENVIRLVAF